MLSIERIFCAASGVIAVVAQVVNFSSIRAWVIGTWTDPVG